MQYIASELHNECLAWLRSTYNEHMFFVERDVVWTIQKRLIKLIKNRGMPLAVFSEYRILSNYRADLVILHKKEVLLAVEYKYEPSHARAGLDIGNGKFPVVSWQEASKDMDKIEDYINKGGVKAACSVLIDEGGYFKNKTVPRNATWENWESCVRVMKKTVIHQVG